MGPKSHYFSSSERIFEGRIVGIFGKEMHGRIPSRELTYPPDKAYLKIIFLFPRWDMLISWRVVVFGVFGVGG